MWCGTARTGAGVANDGFQYNNSYVWLLTMHSGKVVRVTSFFDSIAFDELWKHPRAPDAIPDLPQQRSPAAGHAVKCAMAGNPGHRGRAFTRRCLTLR